MAITTIANAIAGRIYRAEFNKQFGTCVAGVLQSSWMMAQLPAAAIMPSGKTITSSSVANPTVITCNTHGYTTGDQISIIGHTGSTPALDGVYTITNTGGNTFTIPVNVTVAGANGYACCFNTGGTGTPGLTGLSLSNPITGQLPFTNPTSGYSYLDKFEASGYYAGAIYLCDRLWHNAGCLPSFTGTQTFTNSVQIPARDRDGTNAGNEVFAAVEVYSVTGAGTPVMTLTYTNSAGANGKTAATITSPLAASSAQGRLYMFALAAGDTGVQSVQSIKQDVTWTSGNYGVVLFRILARLELLYNQTLNAVDCITGGFPRIYDGTVPFLICLPTQSSHTAYGYVGWTQG